MGDLSRNRWEKRSSVSRGASADELSPSDGGWPSDGGNNLFAMSFSTPSTFAGLATPSTSAGAAEQDMAARQDVKDLRRLVSNLESRCDELRASLEDQAKRQRNSEKNIDDRIESSQSRLQFLEKVLGEGAEKTVTNVEDVFSRIDVHTSPRNGGVEQSTLRQRVDYIEKVLGESAEKHARNLSSAKTVNLLVSNFKARETHHTSVGERIDYIEKVIGDSAEQHARDLQAAQLKLDMFHGRISKCEEHGDHIGSLKKAHTDMERQYEDHVRNHASMKERIDYLERILGDSATKHAKELDEVKEKIASDAKSREKKLKQDQDALTDRVDQMTKENHLLSSMRSSIEDRIKYLEKEVGDSADKHAQELAATRAAQNKLLKEHKERDALHTSIEDRLEYLEKALGDSAMKHARELAAAHVKLDLFHTRINSCEKQSDHIENLRKAHDDLNREHLTMEDTHQSMRDRVDYLEKIIGDSATKHARELRDSKQAQEKLANEAKARDAYHASVEERMSYLERVLGDSADQRAQEKRDAQVKLELLQKRITSCEHHGSQVEALKKAHQSLQKEHTDMDDNHTSLRQRMQNVERSIDRLQRNRDDSSPVSEPSMSPMSLRLQGM